MIEAGNLDHRFFVDTAAEATDAAGQLVSDWDNATTVRRWGRFAPKGSREFALAQQQYSNVQWLVEIRGRLAVTPRMRLRTNETPSRILEILAAWSPDGKSPATAEIVHVACREQNSTAVANTL